VTQRRAPVFVISREWLRSFCPFTPTTVMLHRKNYYRHVCRTIMSLNELSRPICVDNKTVSLIENAQTHSPSCSETQFMMVPTSRRAQSPDKKLIIELHYGKASGQTVARLCESYGQFGGCGRVGEANESRGDGLDSDAKIRPVNG